MLQKSKRLRSAEVKEVLAKGRSIRAEHLQMRYIAATGPMRSAVIVPKALVRKATARNSVRRAAYRALASVPSPSRSAHAIFFVRSVPKTPLTPAFARELSVLFAKI